LSLLLLLPPLPSSTPPPLPPPSLRCFSAVDDTLPLSLLLLLPLLPSSTPPPQLLPPSSLPFYLSVCYFGEDRHWRHRSDRLQPCFLHAC
jgi:hypothetical protein